VAAVIARLLASLRGLPTERVLFQPPPELSDAARRLSAEAAARRRADAKLRREDRSAWVKAHCAQILASMNPSPEQQDLFHE
jgi:hypothetical protein